MPPVETVVQQAPDTDGPVISVRGLRKRYRDLEAVRGLDFDIRRGEIFGLIGPDGAGKTTIFHILGGVMEPTAGQVAVVGRKPADARSEIGYLTQQFSLNLDLSVDENLSYTAGLRRVPEPMVSERRRRYLKLMGLDAFGSRLAGQLSGGMKQKLALCCALMSRPQVLLLDEPTTGVDPVSRREFWDVLAGIAHEGMTIAVATPYLDEAERCDRVALVHEGAIRQIGTPVELRERLGLHRLEVRTSDLGRLEQALAPGGSVESAEIADVQPFGDRLDVLVADSERGERYLQSIAASAGIGALRIDRDEPTLENVFVLNLRKEGLGTTAYKPFAFSGPALGPSRKTSAIAASKLSKQFGEFQAVKGVSLQIGYGEIYGLLGANGAGKTTTIKMICGLLQPSSGEMMLAGETQRMRSPALRQRIGYMSQKFTLYDDLTILQNLEFYCGVYQVPMGLRKERINWVLSTCQLVGREGMITGLLPGGWKQRLSFGASVMHEPEILFLDEPTSGVDPIARRQLWNMIRDFARHGTAILVTTHFLEEAENCHRLGLMAAGELVAQGSPSEIKKAQPGQLIVLVTSDTQRSSDLLKTKLESWRVAIFADKLHVVLDEPERQLPALVSLLSENGIQVRSQMAGSFSLEDAFIGLVQRRGGVQS